MNTNPGSGKYEVDRGIAKQKDKGNMIGKSKRTNFSSNNKAGVGDYDILKKKTGGISIPKAERFAVTNKNPGPGDYNNQTTISNFHLYKKTF